MERRKQRRYPRRMVVHFVVDGIPARYTGYTTNISHAGMFISSSHMPAQGAQVSLEISMKEETIRLQAELVRQRLVPLQLRTVQPSGFAVRFIGDASPLVAILPPEGASSSMGGFGPEGPSARPSGSMPIVLPPATRPSGSMPSVSPPTTRPSGSMPSVPAPASMGSLLPSAMPAGAVPLPVAPTGSTAVAGAPVTEGTLIRLALNGPMALAELMRRELRFGAIFVPNAMKHIQGVLGRGAPITLEVSLGSRSVRLFGRVAATVANGITVAITELDAATEALKGLAP